MIWDWAAFVVIVIVKSAILNGTNVTRKFGGFRLIDGENVNPLNQHQILRMVNLVIKAPPDLNLTSWLAD